MATTRGHARHARRIDAPAGGRYQLSELLAASSTLYWADRNGGTIWEANLDGTGAHPFVMNKGNPTEVAVGP